jgi:hypothetical protein
MKSVIRPYGNGPSSFRNVMSKACSRSLLGVIIAMSEGEVA